MVEVNHIHFSSLLVLMKGYFSGIIMYLIMRMDVTIYNILFMPKYLSLSCKWEHQGIKWHYKYH